jgi:hypothetical protein
MRDTIDMAREAGFDIEQGALLQIYLDHFAELVRADERDRAMRENAYVQAEREACAKLVEDAVWFTKFLVAKAIRARGNT